MLNLYDGRRRRKVLVPDEDGPIFLRTVFVGDFHYGGVLIVRRSTEIGFSFTFATVISKTVLIGTSYTLKVRRNYTD